VITAASSEARFFLGFPDFSVGGTDCVRVRELQDDVFHPVLALLRRDDCEKPGGAIRHQELNFSQGT
jgi:hypothetical protein